MSEILRRTSGTRASIQEREVGLSDRGTCPSHRTLRQSGQTGSVACSRNTTLGAAARLHDARLEDIEDAGECGSICNPRTVAFGFLSPGVAGAVRCRSLDLCRKSARLIG